MEYNTKRELSSYSEQLEVITNHGFNPIAVSQMYFEDTYVFETNEEATSAYNVLEKHDSTNVVGWWYGREQFLEAIKEYEQEANRDCKVLVYWLDRKL